MWSEYSKQGASGKAEVTEAGGDWNTQPVSQQELEHHCECGGEPSRVVNQKPCDLIFICIKAILAAV